MPETQQGNAMTSLVFLWKALTWGILFQTRNFVIVFQTFGC